MPRYDPQYCPYCGKQLTTRPSPGKLCESCDEAVFQQPVIAVETLVVDSEKVLLQKRGTGRFPGTWGFPGGHVELGEAPWQAAARELAEETGLTVSPTDLIPFDTAFDKNKDGSYYVIIGYAVTRADTDGSLTDAARETSAVQFYHLSELPDSNQLFHPEYRSRIESAIRYIHHNDTEPVTVTDLR